MENNQEHEYVIYDIRLNITPEENKLLEEKFQRYDDEYGIYIIVNYLEEIYQTYAVELSSFNSIKLPPLESGGFWLKCLNQSLNI